MVRPECLQPAAKWIRPTGDEIKYVLKLGGHTGGSAAQFLGLGKNSDRTVRRWTSEDSSIPYASWALLCHSAGLGEIWKPSSAE
uniref:transcriptional regulator n=1 Tax=Thaumasiovibrio occultus TaxID=1891184 RepID=UPI000B34C710|nr:transcriptional regulator [Thaumasiovibrio occultus]